MEVFLRDAIIEMSVGGKCKTEGWKTSVSGEVSFSVCSLRPQVRGEQPGAAGGRRLHDRLSKRSNSPQEDAWHRLAEAMLPDD